MKTKPHKIRHRAERVFANFLKESGLEFVYQPATFHFKAISYRPDFYVPKYGTFYEVVGSRQAYSLTRQKINLLEKIYPFLTILPVNPDGSPYRSRSVRVQAPPPEQSYTLEVPESTLTLKQIAKKKQNQIAEQLLICPTYFSDIINLRAKPSKRLLRDITKWVEENKGKGAALVISEILKDKNQKPRERKRTKPRKSYQPSKEVKFLRFIVPKFRVPIQSISADSRKFDPTGTGITREHLAKVIHYGFNPRPEGRVNQIIVQLVQSLKIRSAKLIAEQNCQRAISESKVMSK
jgi:hypothetical protein